MATKGSATRVTSEPKIEMVAAAQTRWKAPLRHSDAIGQLVAAAGTVSGSTQRHLSQAIARARVVRRRATLGTTVFDDLSERLRGVLAG